MNNYTPTHLSLFSGIGGLDIAAESAGFKTVGQVEISDFCNKVLEKNFPGVERWKDVREFTVDGFRRRTGMQTVDIISGGFPCQPHSLAGKRLASCDERDLWGEFRRIICGFRPQWVVAENVRGLLSSEHGRFFAGILRDFSEMGYNVGWCLLSAAAVGAIHRRERVALIAYSDSKSMLQANTKANTAGALRETRKLPAGRDWYFTSGTYWTIHKPPIFGMVNGISGGMDSFLVYKAQMTALGNAVCPQQFFPVFKAIYESYYNTENSQILTQRKDT